MSSNEEYLDNLLKSMGGSDDAKAESNSVMSAEEIEAMFAAAERAASGNDAAASPESEPETTAEDGLQEENVMPAEEILAEKILPGDEQTEEDSAEETVNAAALSGKEEVQPVAEAEENAGHSVESTQSLSQEEIERLLEESSQPGLDVPSQEEADVSTEEQGTGNDEFGNDDLLSLLGSLQDDSELSEIGDLLEKADNNEAVDESIFSVPEKGEANVPNDTDASEAGSKRGEGEEGEPSDGKDGIKKKKRGLFAKLFSALTEEEEDSELDENQAIMQTLEAEDREEAGKKKKIKKGKMPSSGKKGQKAEEGEEEEEKGGKAKKKGKSQKDKGKKEKPKKAPKPKKEKAPKEGISAEKEKPSKKISKKSIFVVVLFAATVFAVVLFAVTFFSDEISMQSAKEAFNRQDYITCYETMYGMELSEEESEMFEHAGIVLKTQRRIEVYEQYLEEDRELEALDSLMQAVANYDDVYGRAQSCGAATEVAALYDRIWKILADNYGLTKEDARAIALCESNVDYTRYLTALTGGESISGDGGEGSITLPEEEMQDVLPAEEELAQPNFAD